MTSRPEADGHGGERRLLAMFEALLALDGPAREARLADHHRHHPGEAARLRALLAADGVTGDMLSTGGAIRADPDRMPERIGAYRITGLIGRGGMGAVYRGERATGDFDHQVAIKVVRPGPLSDLLVERFRAERRILAGLEHPHVARLFDGGETPQGEPYFVMEHVDGPTLLDMLADGSVAPDRLLDLFEQACTAVQYAHQRLIVHGDITPANILVERGGTRAKLIDFGISRVSDKADAPADGTLRPLITRAYAAPERAAGQPATIASDVFGLGGVLADIMAALPARLRDAELAAIAAKATDPDPDRRYGSVADLLADLGRRKAGFPVLAMPASPAYRLRKLVARHRLLFGSLSLGVAGLIVALVVTIGLYRRAEAARAAEAERFAQVRALARYQLFDLYEAVANLPRSTPVREGMVRVAQTYLDELRQVRAPTPALVMETAESYRRLGDIQGGPGIANVGNKDGAKASYARGLAMLDALGHETRVGDDWRLARARLLLSKARSDFFNDFQPASAVAAARAAEEILRDASPGPVITPMRAVAAAATGEYLLYSGENAAASRTMQRAEAAFAAIDPRALPADIAEEMGVRRAANFRNQSLAFIELKQPARALNALTGGDALWAEMRQRSPDNRRYMRSHAIHLMQLGAVQGDLDRPDAAQAAYAEAERLARLNLSLDPADEAGRFAVESISAERAHYLGTIGKTEAALALLRPILARRQALADAAPDDPKRAVDALVMLRPFGDVYRAAGDTAGACRAYRRAKDAFDAFGRRHGLPEELRNTEYRDVVSAVSSCVSASRG